MENECPVQAAWKLNAQNESKSTDLLINLLGIARQGVGEEDGGTIVPYIRYFDSPVDDLWQLLQTRADIAEKVISFLNKQRLLHKLILSPTWSLLYYVSLFRPPGLEIDAISTQYCASLQIRVMSSSVDPAQTSQKSSSGYTWP